LGGDLTLSGTFSGPVILIDNDGTDPLGGTFDSVNGLGSLTLNYSGGDGNDLELVPEPASLVLLALCGVVALRRRRR